MAEEIVYSGSLVEKDFLKLIAACNHANMFTDALVLIEDFPNKVIKEKDRQDLLLFERFTLDLPFAQCVSGRIFTEQLELRWVRKEQALHIVYLGDTQHASLLNSYPFKNRKSRSVPLEPDELKVNTKFYVLFGERLRPEDRKRISSAQPGDFAEARIPRLLRYPPPDWKDQGVPQKSEVVQKKPYMQLQVREYLDKVGNLVLFRFQCLKATGELRA